MSMPKCWLCLWTGFALAGLVSFAPVEARAQEASPPAAATQPVPVAPEATTRPVPAPPIAVLEVSPADERQQEKVEVQGKIIVIGPDGERREFDFGREFPQTRFHVRPMHMFRVGPNGEGEGAVRWTIVDPAHAPEGDYMIGLDCNPADDTLRAQLGLGEAGLVVRVVMEGSPAANAGLQPHDVLTRVGDRELTSIDVLMEAVRDSEGQALTLTYLREGKEQTAEVTPVERVELTARVEDPKQLRAWIEERVDGPPAFTARIPDFRVQAVRPGVVFEAHPEPSNRLDELAEQINRLNEQVAAMQQAIEELKTSQE
jgi:hypothetical protein